MCLDFESTGLGDLRNKAERLYYDDDDNEEKQEAQAFTEDVKDPTGEKPALKKTKQSNLC